MGPAAPLAARAGGCLLHVVVSPQARRNGADGLHDGALRVRLTAPPLDGRANAALLDWLGGELGLARRELAIVRGKTSRHKTVAVARPEAEVAAWLMRVLATAD